MKTKPEPLVPPAFAEAFLKRTGLVKHQNKMFLDGMWIKDYPKKPQVTEDLPKNGIQKRPSEST